MNDSAVVLSFSIPPSLSPLNADSSPHNDALTSWWVDITFRVGWTARTGFITVTTSTSTTIQLDTVALAGDTVPFTCAWPVTVIRNRGCRARRRAVGSAGQAGANGWWWWRAEVVVVVFLDSSSTEARCKVLDRRTIVIVEDVLGGVWRDWLWWLDLWSGQRSTLRDVDCMIARLPTGRSFLRWWGLRGTLVLIRRRRLVTWLWWWLGIWNIEDI